MPNGLMPRQAMAGDPAMGQGAAPPGGQPAGVQPPGGQPGEEDIGPAELAPEEKELYLEVATNASNILYDGKTPDTVARMVKNPDSAVEPLSRMVAAIVEKVTLEGLRAGKKIDPDMAVGVAANLTGEVTQAIPEAAGLPPLGQEPAQAVFLRSIELLEDRRRDLLDATQENGAPAPQSPGGGGGMMPSASPGPPPAGGMGPQVR